jgi:hypothetical protein
VTGALLIALTRALSADAPADHTIEGPLIVRSGRISVGLVHSIAKYAHVPIGIEALPFDDPASDDQREQQKVLTGLTVREALDIMVQADPRYRWVEAHGVIVIRPVKAWSDSRHFLNAVMSDFSIAGRDIADVLDALRAFLQDGEVRFRAVPWPVSVPVTMSLKNTSALEVLNATIGHGGVLVWTITYERTANPGFVSINLFDPEKNRGHGVSVRLPLPEWLSAR